MTNRELNLRDLGRIPNVPRGLFLRSGKLSILGPQGCAKLCSKHHIQCVIDLRTTVESAEYPDPLPSGIEYLSIPLLKNETIGITHETGSDPIAIIRSMRKEPQKLLDMLPDFTSLYKLIVTDEYSRNQLFRAVSILRRNAEKGACTLFHCTAGKDRTGILSMALLKSYGISDQEIVDDYLLTNRNALLPTIRKCLGIGLMTWDWSLVKAAYRSFMADKKLIETAIRYYQPDSASENTNECDTVTL